MSVRLRESVSVRVRVRACELSVERVREWSVRVVCVSVR